MSVLQQKVFRFFYNFPQLIFMVYEGNSNVEKHRDRAYFWAMPKNVSKDTIYRQKVF